MLSRAATPLVGFYILTCAVLFVLDVAAFNGPSLLIARQGPGIVDIRHQKDVDPNSLDALFPDGRHPDDLFPARHSDMDVDRDAAREVQDAAGYIEELEGLRAGALTAAVRDADSPNTATTDPQYCQVANIQGHDQFDMGRYAGKWYLISDYNIAGQVITNFLDIDDVQAIFYMRPDNTMKIVTAARIIPKIFDYKIPYISKCFVTKGYGLLPNASEPAKFSIHYKSLFSSSLTSWNRPYWVISTDYNYALFYSCFKTGDDGTCLPESTFAWTLNRRRSGHSHMQNHMIAMAARRACLDPDEFRLRETDQICPGIYN